jgi:ubiquinone/menaquinone biosynthesis C-methylase UbiE
MSLLKEKIKSNLDLACGTGMFAAKLKKNYPNITIDGCDISSQSLKIANKKETLQKINQTKF